VVVLDYDHCKIVKTFLEPKAMRINQWASSLAIFLKSSAVQFLVSSVVVLDYEHRKIGKPFLEPKTMSIVIICALRSLPNLNLHHMFSSIFSTRFPRITLMTHMPDKWSQYFYFLSSRFRESMGIISFFSFSTSPIYDSCLVIIEVWLSGWEPTIIRRSAG